MAEIGVPKKMPEIGRGTHTQGGSFEKGIQRLRNGRGDIMTDKLKAPFPWTGGKSDMAPAIWSRLGQPDNYVEPFAGSAALLLARPDGAHGTETVNDIDGLLINAYRAIQYAPEETAEACDWPVSEADLTARHLWLKAQRAELTARLFADPLYCDVTAAGWWLWGIASWIGDGWCVADGPWINVDGRLVDRRTIGSEDAGVHRKMPEVGAGKLWPKNGRGVMKPEFRASVPRKMPEIGRREKSHSGSTPKGVQAYRHHDGVPKQMPRIGGNVTDTCSSEPGVRKFDDSALAAYFTRLADRLRRVRFLCGDWQRAVKDSVTVNHGLTAVFLDPPYPQAEHDMSYHEEQVGDVWHAAAAWAVAHGDDTRLRICIAGYWSEATDALFPATWERLRWEARGGYANQKADGRGRANAKRECLWFSPQCLDPAEVARAAFDQPIRVRESDYTGTLFEESDET
jgi:hypothetical protein